MRIKPINPIARAMLRSRQSPQVVPNKKKNYVPDIDDYDDVYIDMATGEIKSDDGDDDDPHDEMLPPKPKKEK